MLSVAVVLAACGVDTAPPAADGGDGLTDAGTGDAGASDAGTTDAGLADAGAPDAGVDGGVSGAGDAGADAGAPDAGGADAGAADAGGADAGGVDAGGADAGGADAGGADAGAPDAGVADAGRADAGLPCARCATYGPVVNAGALATAALTETSGLAVSRSNPGILYGHNDSGGQPTVYVLGANGAALGELRLTGASNRDWEDLALGPCPAGTCIYVGEIGDNGANSGVPISVYRVAEPVVPPGTSIGALAVAAERFDLAYPNGESHDAETLLVHPTTGDVYVVTKRPFGQRSAAYRATAPLQAPPAVNALVKVADLQVPDGLDLPLTGGDIEPCGQAVLLRSYSALYLFEVPAGGAFDAVFTASFRRVSSPPFPSGEAQGEAVAWSPGGGYVTVSEGAGAQLHTVSCQ